MRNGKAGDGVQRWMIASPKVSRVVAATRKTLEVQHQADSISTCGGRVRYPRHHLGRGRLLRGTIQTHRLSIDAEHGLCGTTNALCR
jgi:hypothetical protein